MGDALISPPSLVTDAHGFHDNFSFRRELSLREYFNESGLGRWPHPCGIEKVIAMNSDNDLLEGWSSEAWWWHKEKAETYAGANDGVHFPIPGYFGRIA